MQTLDLERTEPRIGGQNNSLKKLNLMGRLCLAYGKMTCMTTSYIEEVDSPQPVPQPPYDGCHDTT
jgi:hypothetical protein